MSDLISILLDKTRLKAEHVKNILQLLEDGATIPFIARYRKELTGGATDEQLREFEEVYAYSKKLLERKEDALHVFHSLHEQGKWIGELRAKRKDGSLFDIQVLANMVKNEGGGPICAMASFLDITARKK